MIAPIIDMVEWSLRSVLKNLIGFQSQLPKKYDVELLEVLLGKRKAQN